MKSAVLFCTGVALAGATLFDSHIQIQDIRFDVQPPLEQSAVAPSPEELFITSNSSSSSSAVKCKANLIFSICKLSSFRFSI